MKQFFRSLFLFSTIFSFNLNFVKAETEEEAVISYVLSFLETGNINKAGLEQKTKSYFFAKQLQQQPQTGNIPASTKDLIAPRVDYISTPNIDFIDQADVKPLYLIAKQIIEKRCEQQDKVNTNSTLQKTSNQASGLLKQLNKNNHPNSIILMQYLVNIPLETLIVTPIIEILTTDNWQNSRFSSLENQILKYYQQASQTNQNDLKEQIALNVRVKLFEFWSKNIQENRTEYVKQQIQEKIRAISNTNISDQSNLFAILKQLVINTEAEQQIEDDLGNRGFIIPINPICVLVVLSIGTSFYYYYLSTHSQAELFEQINDVWNWMKNYLGFPG